MLTYSWNQFNSFVICSRFEMIVKLYYVIYVCSDEITVSYTEKRGRFEDLQVHDKIGCLRQRTSKQMSEFDVIMSGDLN